MGDLPTPPYTEATKQDPYGVLAEDVALRTARRYGLPADQNEFELAMMHAALDAVTEALHRARMAGLLLPEGAETRTEAKPSTKDLPLQPGDRVAFTSPSLFPGRESERLTGEVVGVADDGYATVSVPQSGYEPMEVTAPADVFARLRLAPDVDAAFAAGRAQAAADIREYAERLRTSSWNAHTGVALGAIADEAAKIAEGGGVADQSKEQA